MLDNGIIEVLIIYVEPTLDHIYHFKVELTDLN